MTIAVYETSFPTFHTVNLFKDYTGSFRLKLCRTSPGFQSAPCRLYGCHAVEVGSLQDHWLSDQSASNICAVTCPGARRCEATRSPVNLTAYKWRADQGGRSRQPSNSFVMLTLHAILQLSLNPCWVQHLHVRLHSAPEVPSRLAGHVALTLTTVQPTPHHLDCQTLACHTGTRLGGMLKRDWAVAADYHRSTDRSGQCG